MQLALLTARQSCRACDRQWPASGQAAAVHPPCSRQSERFQLQLIVEGLHPFSINTAATLPAWSALYDPPAGRPALRLLTPLDIVRVCAASTATSGTLPCCSAGRR